VSEIWVVWGEEERERERVRRIERGSRDKRKWGGERKEERRRKERDRGRVWDRIY
jgi:hypothetical protein